MKRWVKAAGIRAIRTFAQAFVAMIPTTGILLTEIDWPLCLSGAALAAILSFLTSIAGLPEVKDEDTRELPDEK